MSFLGIVQTARIQIPLYNIIVDVFQYMVGVHNICSFALSLSTEHWSQIVQIYINFGSVLSDLTFILYTEKPSKISEAVSFFANSCKVINKLSDIKIIISYSTLYGIIIIYYYYIQDLSLDLRPQGGVYYHFIHIISSLYMS